MQCFPVRRKSLQSTKSSPETAAEPLGTGRD